LPTIITDEIAHRTHKRLASALRRANFRNQKTLEEFDFTFNPNINCALITDLASCWFIEERVPVLIVCPCETSKSYIAQGLGHCAIRAGYDVLFTTVSKMLAQMNAGRANNGYDRHFAKLAAVDLLIIEDFGLKPLQESQERLSKNLKSKHFSVFCGL
jgi:DNA replication protein DnaC